MHMTSNDGWTSLHDSAKNGTYKLVKFFADMKAGIYVENNLEATAFILRHSLDILIFAIYF